MKCEMVSKIQYDRPDKNRFYFLFSENKKKYVAESEYRNLFLIGCKMLRRLCQIKTKY